MDAPYRINNTIMRVDLPEPLESGDVVEFEVDWSFLVPDRGRGGKELVGDGWIYEMAQWFPRIGQFGRGQIAQRLDDLQLLEFIELVEFANTLLAEGYLKHEGTLSWNVDKSPAIPQSV